MFGCSITCCVVSRVSYVDDDVSSGEESVSRGVSAWVSSLCACRRAFRSAGTAPDPQPDRRGQSLWIADRIEVMLMG